MSSSTDPLIIRDVTVDGERLDCLVADGVIAELSTRSSLPPQAREIQAGGGALLPGLHDHHVHALAAAAGAASLDLGGGRLPDRGSVPEPRGTSTWIRAVGLGDDAASVTDLDQVWPDRPARVQHRSGALWVLNSVAIELLADVLEPEECADGRIWRGDSRLRQALTDLDQRDIDADLQTWGRHLASWGVTGLTDATVDLSARSLQKIRAQVPQRVVSLGAEDDEMPIKIIADDHTPDLWNELDHCVRAARRRDRPVAVHAVSAASLAVVVAMLEEIGVVEGDRVEHAAVCDDQTADRLAELGLTVVTQPSIAARRGREMVDASEPADRRWLWRIGGLTGRGVRVALSSDAPYGDPNPWSTVRLAAAGLPADQSPWIDDQTIAPRDALASFLARPDDPAGISRQVAVGEVADLCVLDGQLDAVLDRVTSGGTRSPVLLTVVGGLVISRRPGCSDVGA